VITPATHRAVVGPALAGALLVAVSTAGAAVSDRQVRTLPFDPARTLAVDLTIGEVRIIGSERGDVSLEVTRQAPTAEALATMPLVVDEASPARVRVAIVQPDGGTDPALRATVVLRVPRTARLDAVKVQEGKIVVEDFDGTLTADVRRGPIEATAVGGTLRLETGIGSVIVRRGRLAPDGLLRLRAFNGDVRLQLARAPTDARVLALALNGTISSALPLTMKDTWGPRFGEATIGTGRPVISIDVVTGRVEITID
jgi:hypothetical protein